jgi:hypothetical protein
LKFRLYHEWGCCRISFLSQCTPPPRGGVQAMRSEEFIGVAYGTGRLIKI